MPVACNKQTDQEGNKEMRLRILLSAVLVTAVALPVIAIATRFPDVPDDHQHIDAIRWASDPEQFNGAALFRGFPDGNFGPDQELTENQFVKVVDRLFDSVDRWTRAETAALLYHGFNALRSGTTTTTTTTTHPVVIEGEEPGGNGPGEEETTTTTTSPEETTTTTTTQPTTTTTTIPPFPIQERLATFDGKIELTKERLARATHKSTGHTEELANDVKEAADDAVDYVTELKEDYAEYLEPADHWTKRISIEYDKAVKWQNNATLLIEWITTDQEQTNPERKLTTEEDEISFYSSGHCYSQCRDHKFGWVPLRHSDEEEFTEEFETRIRNIHTVFWHITNRLNYGADTRRDLYRYVYYHTLWLVKQLDNYKTTLTYPKNRQQATNIQSAIYYYRQQAYRWLAADAGF